MQGYINLAVADYESQMAALTRLGRLQGVAVERKGRDGRRVGRDHRPELYRLLDGLGTGSVAIAHPDCLSKHPTTLAIFLHLIRARGGVVVFADGSEQLGLLAAAIDFVEDAHWYMREAAAVLAKGDGNPKKLYKKGNLTPPYGWAWAAGPSGERLSDKTGGHWWVPLWAHQRALIAVWAYRLKCGDEVLLSGAGDAPFYHPRPTPIRLAELYRKSTPSSRRSLRECIDFLASGAGLFSGPVATKKGAPRWQKTTLQRTMHAALGQWLETPVGTPWDPALKP